MTILLRMEESRPESQDAPEGVSEAAATVDAGLVWQRLEGFVSARWHVRAVTWTLQGPGEWVPNLYPVSVTSTEGWANGAWESVTLDPSPLGGLILPGTRAYRVTGTAGGSAPVPADVAEAFRRLADYMAAETGTLIATGAAEESLQVGGIQMSYQRDPKWRAKAIHNSGAADLLRPYRRR